MFYGKLPLWDALAGNHGSYIHQNKHPVQDDDYVEDLNVITDLKCNKLLNVITFGLKCNKLLNVITFGLKCNNT